MEVDVEKSKPTGNNVDLANETMMISPTGSKAFRTTID
jgi:hypothetical protein